jgi:hypothetical protein
MSGNIELKFSTAPKRKNEFKQKESAKSSAKSTNF